MSRLFLHPNEEDLWAHAKTSSATLSITICCISAVFLFIALLTAPNDYAIPIDNVYNSTWELQVDMAIAADRSWIINRKGDNVTFEKTALLKDRALRSMGMKRIDFGTTWNTYCWDDSLPARPFFPSLLRLMEFRPLTQAFLRLTVLSLIVWRMLLLFFRFRCLMIVWRAYSERLEQFARLSPIVVFAESFFAFRVLLQHQDADKQYKDLTAQSLTLFGVFCGVHMLVHLAVDWASKKSLYRSVLRILCLAVFVAAIPYCVQSQLAFLHRKTCTPFVPLLWALPDYAGLLSVLLFHSSLLWELPHLHLMLSPLPGEFNFPSSNPCYKAFIE